ncbi:MAG: hypothetical protein R3208_22235 [Ketobacteraceae bacterium]|nr:hypothetical protein [Ketobacteraceae bacterium]
MLYLKPRSHALRMFTSLLLLWSLSGAARADYFTKLDWQATLQELYQDVGNAYRKFVNSLGEGGAPQALNEWVDSFTSQPFSDRDIVQDLNELSGKLESQFNEQQLSAKTQQQLNAFVGILQNISSDITSGIAGGETMSNSRRIEALKQLETLHDGDQAWVNARGKQLAEKLQNYDVEGAISLLGDIVDEYKRQQ